MMLVDFSLVNWRGRSGYSPLWFGWQYDSTSGSCWGQHRSVQGTYSHRYWS